MNTEKKFGAINLLKTLLLELEKRSLPKKICKNGLSLHPKRKELL
jgi:hypothetical protein